MTTQYEILRNPVLSEKAVLLKEGFRQICLEVKKDANKHQIKQATQGLFGIKVEAVNTSIYRGKTKRVGRKMGKRPNWKKAVLTLSVDSDLDVFGILQPPEIPEEQPAAE